MSSNSNQSNSNANQAATHPSLHPDLLLPTPEQLEQLSPEALAQILNGAGGQGLSGTLGQRLGITMLRASKTELVAEMPVAGNFQPAGRLHGGASIALAEELASIGSWLNVNLREEAAVGVDINATHIRGVSAGKVTATARISYQGRRIMVWEVNICDENGKTTSLVRCTCHVVKL